MTSFFSPAIAAGPPGYVPLPRESGQTYGSKFQVNSSSSVGNHNRLRDVRRSKQKNVVTKRG